MNVEKIASMASRVNIAPGLPEDLRADILALADFAMEAALADESIEPSIRERNRWLNLAADHLPPTLSRWAKAELLANLVGEPGADHREARLILRTAARYGRLPTTPRRLFDLLEF